MVTNWEGTCDTTDFAWFNLFIKSRIQLSIAYVKDGESCFKEVRWVYSLAISLFSLGIIVLFDWF